ncbi:MAG: hypothetical protein QW796_04030 [Thermoproteota archaeon]
MTEEGQEALQPQPLPEPKRGIYGLIEQLRGGKTDPLMALLLLSELRRMERDEERWAIERQMLLSNPQKVDVEKLVKELNETWEKRFREYQSSLEKLLLGRKAEEAEERAARLEKELKELKEKTEYEKLLKERVEEALTPYKEQISQLQMLLAEKTGRMSENERKTFFQTLGEQIEQSLSQEVTATIAKNIADAIMNAFTPKEEREEKEVPVTPEGKVDWVKTIDRWVKRGLETLKVVAERWPAAKPPVREVEKIPVAPAALPVTSTMTAAPPAAAVQPAPREKAEEPVEEAPAKAKKARKVKEAKGEEKPLEEETGTGSGDAGTRQEATGEGAEGQEPGASD